MWLPTPAAVVIAAVLIVGITVQWAGVILHDRGRYLAAVAPLPSSRVGCWCTRRYLRFRLRRQGLDSLTPAILPIVDRIQRHRATATLWNLGHRTLHTARPHIRSQRHRTTASMVALAAAGTVVGAFGSAGRVRGRRI